MTTAIQRFAPLPALQLVRTPRRVRTLARLLGVLFVLTPPALAFVPWQQTATGSGRVIAYNPLEREQTLQAPVEGRVAKWFVQEGDVVQEGDPIVYLEDNDPTIMTQLQGELDALQRRLTETQDRVSFLNKQLVLLEASRDFVVRAAVERVKAAEQQVKVVRQQQKDFEALLKQTSINFKREAELVKKGLSSQLDYDRAELAFTSAKAKVQQTAEAEEAAARQAEAAAAERENVEKRAGAEIEATQATVRATKADVASLEQQAMPLKLRINRQQTMYVKAPVAGTILKLWANAGQGGGYVKVGDKLATLVPTTDDRAVELWIDGNDAPLIPALMAERRARGEPVYARLQFEGWPALQFTGWPGAAVGTFGGKVKLVDATDNGKGSFRIVVVPDDADGPWPSPDYLRQGVRANGFVLLNEVPLGFELWRRLNGFPPVVAKAEPDGKDAGKPKSGGKK